MSTSDASVRAPEPVAPAADAPIRVSILGAGMAALSTAANLVAQGPGLYDITIHQLGWRAGGKGASGRNRAPGMGMRIEEHGLHVWFGCYHNAWRLLTRCYAALGRESDMLKLFQGQTSTPYMEDVDGWKVWPVWFPRKYGTLGDDTLRQNALGDMRVVAEFVYATSKRFVGHALAMSPDAPAAHRSFFRRILDDVEGAADSIEHRCAAIRALLVQIEQIEEGADPTDLHERIVVAAEAVRLLLRGDPSPVGSISDDIRRDAIMLDLACTALIGLAADLVPIRGYDSIDHEDVRAWFLRHGAFQETVDAAPMRALYDLCFAYEGGTVGWDTANFAAGAALATVLRIVGEYADYVVYEMRAGMGEVVIAPVYQYLKQQGVKFEFFRQIASLEMSADRTTLAAVNFIQQANVKGGIEYDPLFELDCAADGIDSLMCWPSEPKYELLDNGDALRGYNLESKWSGWPGVGNGTLRAGEDFDVAVLAISLAEVQDICADIGRTLPAWGAMFDAMVTVQTASAQLWMMRTVDELGWTYGPVPIDAGPEPMDVWADRSDVMQREKWTSDVPKSLQYLCGPLDESWMKGLPRDPAFPAAGKAAASATTQTWLQSYGTAVWPASVSVGGGGFDWSLLRDPSGASGPGRLAAQYIRANIDPTERYVLSVAGSTFFRLPAGGSGLSNLVLAGDWTHSDWNAGCIEAAVTTGVNAAAVVAGWRSR